MQRVMVISKTKKALMPCHPARARMLLKLGKAKVYKKYPFTLILTDRENGEIQDLEFKVDPGSKTTGLALVLHGAKHKKLVFGAHLNHRGKQISAALLSRRAIRRGRRFRKTRYRQARFNNRTRINGWLPPSIMSRVDNVVSWFKRLSKISAINKIALELVRFDMQKMETPEINGTEYQRGTLLGYEVKEYLLEKWQRKCAYCDKESVPLEIEHIEPKSKGGSNRVSNLTLSCRVCNEKKGNISIKEFLAKKPEKLRKILSQTKQPLKDAAAVNASRYAIGNELKAFGIPVAFSSGGRTKFNRTTQGYKKEHFIDAACVGESGEKVYIPKNIIPLTITACGRGSRRMRLSDKYGFPRAKAKGRKRVEGFKTGDIVIADIPKGKNIGKHLGKVAVRTNGSFNITKKGSVIQGINYKHCRTLHYADGYNYLVGGGVSSPA